MKKKNLILLVLLLGIVLFFTNCLTKPISQHYPERWGKTHIGMSLEEFKQIWPEARGPFKSSFTDDELISYHVSPPINPFSVGTPIIAYFSFKNNILVNINEI